MNTEQTAPEPKSNDQDAPVTDAPAANAPDNDKPAPAPAPVPAPAPQAKAPVADAVVGGGARDEVLLSRCVFKNPATRKSLTIHHLQRRLASLGYNDAAADKDGWYGDHTARAVRAFQDDNKLKGDGIVDAKTFLTIFKGDPNVDVIIDA